MNPLAVRKCVGKLLSRQEPGLLVPKGVWSEDLEREIEKLDTGKDPASLAVQSALLLWNDDLDGSHGIAQDLEDPYGAYLHGIMHRREPDYGNSKYWFRRVGAHPLFPQIRAAALELLSEAPETDRFRSALEKRPDWDALLFIDWCSEATQEHEVAFLRTLQAIEIQGLTFHCLDQAKLPRP